MVRLAESWQDRWVRSLKRMSVVSSVYVCLRCFAVFGRAFVHRLDGNNPDRLGMCVHRW